MNLPQNLHQTISDLLLETDQVTLNHFGKVTAEYKKGHTTTTDILTQADQEIETFLHQHLTKQFPKIGFIGEEGDYQTSDNLNWIIDPIDGTLNFSKGIPMFGTAVTLWHQTTPVYVQLSFPALNETVWAQAGEGLHFNGEKISQVKHNLRSPVILYQHVGSNQEQLQILEKILSTDLPLPVRVGAASYTLALITTGRADLAILINQALWDIGHAPLMAKEAGLACSVISDPPTMETLSEKSYSHTMLLGHQKLIKKVKLQ